MIACALLAAAALSASPGDVLPATPAPLRLSSGLRLRAEVAPGWSEDGFVATGVQAALRLGPVLASAGWTFVPLPSERSEGFGLLVGGGPGLARDVGRWELEGSLLLGFHAHRWADPHDAGPASGQGPAIGLRAGASRALPFGRIRLESGSAIVPLVSLAATVAWSGRHENRFRGAETDGFVAFLSIGIGASLQGG